MKNVCSWSLDFSIACNVCLYIMDGSFLGAGISGSDLYKKNLVEGGGGNAWSTSRHSKDNSKPP
jgi:hypothetical protein